MAESTKTKTKNTINKPVGMVLKQNESRLLFPNDKRKETIYQAFRMRAQIKSEHAYVDNGEVPKLLRLYLLGSKFNSTVEFLVRFGSFEPMIGTKGVNKGIEIGFRVKLKSPLTRKLMTLEVFRKQFKATLMIPK